MSHKSDLQVPEQALKSFKAIYGYFTETLPGFRGTILSETIMNNYLNRDLTKEADNFIWHERNIRRRVSQIKRRMKKNPFSKDILFFQLKEWAEAELSLPEFEEETFEGRVLFRVDKRRQKVQKYRSLMKKVYKDVICLVAFKHTLEELVTLASEGDDDSLVKLVYLDKLFLKAKFFQQRIHLAQSQEDYNFFRKLANRIVKDGFRENLDSSKRAMAVVLL